MDDNRFATLSKRQKECLRLVYRRRTSKEIARDLGIEKSTVDGYLAEAVRHPGARDRRHAAELLAVEEDSPSIVGGDPARVAEIPPAPPPAEPQLRDASPALSPLPFRRRGEAGNDLTPTQRILMILVLSVGLALAFQLVANGVALFNGVVSFVSGRALPPAR